MHFGVEVGDKMGICEVCGSYYGELHHVVYRSQCKHMKNIELNFKYLCAEHHRGKSSPHMKKEIDLKYKKELQDRLKELFHEEYIDIVDIKGRLNITETNANKIVKTLRIFKEGYKSYEVVKVLMGDRLY